MNSAVRSRFDLQSGALNSKPAYTAQLSFLSALLVCGGRAAPGISLASKQQPGAHYLSILCKGKHSNNKTRVAPLAMTGQLPRPGLIPLSYMQPSKPWYQREPSPMLRVEWSLLAG